MAKKRAFFDKDYLNEEVNKIKGRYVPVKSSLLRIALVKQTRCTNLHPNPDDEFSMPEIGPNYQIISNYEHQFKQPTVSGRYLDEPLTVERIYPGGYLILNGHHRWAAAMRLGFDIIPVKIVNLPQEQDIRKILKNSKHDLRVALDLDEVVFGKDGNEYLEKPLIFPLNRIYKDRLRLGIPALFRFLAMKGYDIWVYSSEYYSLGYIKWLFKRYHVHVDGIVTGIKRKSYKRSEEEQRLKSMFENKYVRTIHISRDLIVRTDRGSKDFKDIALNCSDEDWSKEVIRAFKEINADEEN